jgi:hypothetical protein
MARPPYEDEITISWVELHRDPWDIEYSFATPIKDGGRAIGGP